jgi:hypothetical protein
MIPRSAMSSLSTRIRAIPVMTEAAGTDELAASWLGDSISLAAAKPVADMAKTPMATPARKKRLVLSGSSADRAPGPPYNR